MKYLALILFLTASSLTCATTWHVAQDGSGDFEIIQDAVDAAEPGDVIHIHAGRYLHVTEHWDVWGDGSSYADNHVVITKDNLTLQGEGPEVTIVGPASYPSDPGVNYTGISVTYNEASSLTIHGLAIENVNYGVFGACPGLSITDCRFSGHGSGIYLSEADGRTVISSCSFLSLGDGVFGIHDSGDIEIRNSEFENCSYATAFIGNNRVIIEDCALHDNYRGLQFEQGSMGAIRNTRISNCEVFGIRTCLGGYVEVYTCEIEGGQVAVDISGYGGSHIEECTFVDQTFAAAYISSNDPNTITDCNIHNGGQWSVYCIASGDCYLDMRGNYWGTDDEAQIQAWIYDSNDNPERQCTVDFIPFSTVVSVEQKSWSAVKELFRE